MQTPTPTVQISPTADYREGYANSVLVRNSLWDFMLSFGRISQASLDHLAIQNFQAIYLSPQHAKAFLNLLQQRVSHYEATFGEIRLGPEAKEAPPANVVQ